jgi:hypothetical protein
VEEVEATCFDMLVLMGYEPLYAKRQRTYSRRELDAIANEDEKLRATRRVDRTPELLERRSRRQGILTELSIIRNEHGDIPSVAGGLGDQGSD